MGNRLTRLTLRDFLSTEGISARLAVLSACETGIPDLKNADEVIGLPAGLVQIILTLQPSRILEEYTVIFPDCAREEGRFG